MAADKGLIDSVGKAYRSQDTGVSAEYFTQMGRDISSGIEGVGKAMAAKKERERLEKQKRDQILADSIEKANQWTVKLGESAVGQQQFNTAQKYGLEFRNEILKFNNILQKTDVTDPLYGETRAAISEKELELSRLIKSFVIINDFNETIKNDPTKLAGFNSEESIENQISYNNGEFEYEMKDGTANIVINGRNYTAEDFTQNQTPYVASKAPSNAYIDLGTNIMNLGRKGQELSESTKTQLMKSVSDLVKTDDLQSRINLASMFEPDGIFEDVNLSDGLGENIGKRIMSADTEISSKAIEEAKLKLFGKTTVNPTTGIPQSDNSGILYRGLQDIYDENKSIYDKEQEVNNTSVGTLSQTDKDRQRNNKDFELVYTQQINRLVSTSDEKTNYRDFTREMNKGTSYKGVQISFDPGGGGIRGSANAHFKVTKGQSMNIFTIEQMKNPKVDGSFFTWMKNI